jgi:flagellar basal-body rod modification protein FlgD
MGQDTFMKLLVAELKQQDPMDPMQARDMVAQLATLSSVQKLTAIDTKIGTLNDDSVHSASLQSANLIGRKVTANKSRLALTGIGLPSGGYQLPSAAEKVNVKVLDSTGNTVTSLDLGAQKPGARTFEWDGKNEGGTRLPNGTYTFQVTATDAKGVAVPATTQVSGVVSEVSYQNGAAEVLVDGARVSLADVTQIAQ